MPNPDTRTDDNAMRHYYQPPPQRHPSYGNPPFQYRPAPAWGDYPNNKPPGTYGHEYYPPPYPMPPPTFPTNRSHTATARCHTPPPPPVVYVHPTQSSNSRTASQELIYELRDADVLCGRGAPSNYHSGNKYFRELVNRFQSNYIAARRVDKPEIASRIVEMVRERGGRFLKRTKIQGVGPSGHFCWQDIGEQRAYEKACQALREGAPELRRKLAAKEIAAAALCLDSISRPPNSVSVDEEERDDHETRNPEPSLRSFYPEERDSPADSGRE